MKKLGVIGGLGPMATAYFFQLVTQMSYAECDQEHMETIIYSKPNIADRTKYILNRNEKNPVGDIIEVGNILKASGADVIAIPCITAHFFHSEAEIKQKSESCQRMEPYKVSCSKRLFKIMDCKAFCRMKKIRKK